MTGFEKDDGFIQGDLQGQRGWSVDQGEATVAPGVGVNQSTGLRISPSVPTGQVSLTLERPAGDVVFSDFKIKPVAATVLAESQFADVEGSIAGFFKLDADGYLFVLDGDGFVATSVRPLPAGRRRSACASSSIDRTPIHTGQLGTILYNDAIMSPTLSKLRSEALQLSDEEREILASELWGSLEGESDPTAEIDAAWNSEISSRLQDIKDGKVEGINCEQIEAQMMAKFAWLQ